VPSHHHYEFDRLPERIQRQLGRAVADESFRLAEEGGNDLWFYATRVLGIAVLAALLALSMAAVFGQPGKDHLWNSPGRMMLYGLFIAGLAYIGAAMYQRRYLSALFGFRPGQYLFGYTLLDARKRRLTVVDLTQVRDVKVTQHLVNGIYTHTAFAFAFRDAATRTWKVSNRQRAERFGQKLDSLQAQARTAFDRNDIASLLRLDPFFEIRRKDWRVPAGPDVEPPSHWMRLLSQPLLVAGVAAFVLSPLVWAARTAAADVAAHKQAIQLKTEQAYADYVIDGKFHVKPMRAALPRVAFEEVRRKKSVTALRALLKRYPQAGLKPDVAKEVHALYQEALSRFAAQAATSDPDLMGSMTQLMQVLEQRGDPHVGIRFIRPSNEALAQMDEKIRINAARLGGRQIIPAAAHFASDSAAVREARIVTGLRSGFATIFPNDVLALTQIGVADKRLPVLTIDYQIEPSGAYYTLEKTDRAFVGLVARFQSGLQVGAATQPWRFNMEVEPPDHFRVDYTRPKDQLAKGPDDSQVYLVMAERAFDALSSKMRAAFFRQDSEAFKGMAVVAGPGSI
jgi:hypothetical protein